MEPDWSTHRITWSRSAWVLNLRAQPASASSLSSRRAPSTSLAPAAARCRGCLAEPAARAGDDDDLAVDVLRHGCSLKFRGDDQCAGDDARARMPAAQRLVVAVSCAG